MATALAKVSGVSVPPIKKLNFPAGQAFGPLSGLGALEWGSQGDMRRILGARIDLPIALPAPFLWELHLIALEDVPLLHLTLAGAAAPCEIRLIAGQRTEALGAVQTRPGQPAPRLSFTLSPGIVQIYFLGLSLLPLGAWLQP